MDTRANHTHRTKRRLSDGNHDSDRLSAATARAEVVDILATAVFAILLEGRAPRSKPERAEQQGRCS